MKKFIKILGGAVFSLVLCFSLVFGALILGENGENSTNISSAWEYKSVDLLVEELLSDDIELADSYDLTELYPISSENQVDTTFCWLFASLKVLETSLMVQKGEYYNFSEVGMAVLGKETGVISSFDNMYNFKTFCEIAKGYGLVYESDFSNDNYVGLTNSNSTKFYELLEGNIDTFLSELFEPIIISDNANTTTAFSELTTNQKQTFLKAYIQKYGGFFAGVERGVISSLNNCYYKLADDETPDSDNDGYIQTNHAVCIIGYNSTGFIALNSWGVENGAYSTFIIPYDYANSDFFIGNIYGIYCIDTDDESENSLVSSSATQFASSTGYSGELKNIFSYGVAIELEFSLEVNVNDVAVQITSRGNDYSSYFDFSVSGSNLIISNSDSLTGLGGSYKILFLTNETVFYVTEFYVYTGLEIAYTKLDVSGSTSGYIRLSNTFSTNETTATYYISNIGGLTSTYNLRFYLPAYCTNTNTLWLSSVEITSQDEYGQITVEDATSSFNVDITTSQTYLYIATISRLTNQNTYNKLISFTFGYSASYYGPEVYFTIQFFIGNAYTVNEDNIYSVIYNLNGGENSSSNVKFVPNYENDPNMTGVIINNPTKANATFLGWYLDKDFTTELTYTLVEGDGGDLVKQYYISNTISDDISLYALWEAEEIIYFVSEISVESVKNYYGVDQDIEYSSNGDQQVLILEYGDSIILNYKITQYDNEQEFDTYSIRVRYYLGEISIGESKYFEDEVGDFDIEISDLSLLSAGNKTISFEVYMVINHQIIKTEYYYLNLTINKKVVSIDESVVYEYDYDATAHSPDIELIGVYEEISFKSEIASKVDAGTYEYELSELDSDNYELDKTYKITMTINKAKIGIIWGELSVIYNGVVQSPSCSVVEADKYDGDVLFVSLEIEGQDSVLVKNVGIYKVTVTGFTGSSAGNYELVGDNLEVEFEITKASLTIIFDDITEKLRIDPVNRNKNFTYTIQGTLYGSDQVSDLNIVAYSEGVNATEIGTYEITATASNPNYDITIYNGTYTLTGYYSVYYYLDGELIYIEEVDEGENPVGLTSDIYKKPFLSTLSYSEELVFTGDDIYVDVTVTSYAWALFVGVAILAFVGIYIFFTLKSRKKER